MLAVTVPLNVPGVVGMPLIVPLEPNVEPGGRLPAVRLNVGAFVAVYVKL